VAEPPPLQPASAPVFGALPKRPDYDKRVGAAELPILPNHSLTAKGYRLGVAVATADRDTRVFE